MKQVSIILAGVLLICPSTGISRAADVAGASPQAGVAPVGGFLQAKTFFQTNIPYDPRVAIAVDAIVVHRHGDSPPSLSRALDSWKDKGFIVGRMFFADSDATNAYWKGKWDGTPHEDEVERDAQGKPVLCSGVRPYMLPTEGWARHLEEMILHSIDAGTVAVLPEEPLGHVHTGYEEAFKPLWQQRYGQPWQPENASAEARYLTGQLKAELYMQLEARLARLTKARAKELGRDITFLMPVHAIYSNRASHLTAPMGMAADVPEIDGYVGQVWTGPVNWCLANYSSPDKSFFASAYALYDYFMALTLGGNKKLWLLADPVEDDPNHTWAEFEQWYRHCLAAKLMFPGTAAYEVMPWPDRIFMPGYAMGGGTPAPERYRSALLSAVQVLQEVPPGGRWFNRFDAALEPAKLPRIGVAVADSLLWEYDRPPILDGIYGLLLPLINRGIPVAACVMERAGEKDYLRGFDVIVLSYEVFKPQAESMNVALASYVRQGGVLVVLGEPGGLKGDLFWWNKQGESSPLQNLCNRLDVTIDDGDRHVDRGWCIRRGISPRQFATPATANEQYLPLLQHALSKAGSGKPLPEAPAFCMRRGPFVIVHALSQSLTLPGRYVDVLDADLPVIDGVHLAPGESGVYKDATAILTTTASGVMPTILHCTHRLMRQTHDAAHSEFTLRGPAETPAVVRLFPAGRTVDTLQARAADGSTIAVQTAAQGDTMQLRFPNVPEGVTVGVRWKK